MGYHPGTWIGLKDTNAVFNVIDINQLIFDLYSRSHVVSQVSNTKYVLNKICKIIDINHFSPVVAYVFENKELSRYLMRHRANR